ncbi:MAG: hypothetical protein ACRCT8_05940 [Lacipirellulaceae bacterium]
MNARGSLRPQPGIFLLSALLCLAGPIPPSDADGALVYGEPAALAGLRVVSAPGLATAEPDWLDATIAWSVSPNGDGTFDYEYTLTGFDRPAVSHVTLDLTDDAVRDPDAVTNPRLNGSPAPVEIGNKDGITGAVKFDEGADGTVVYTFTSNREPVWGDVFVKGGSSAEVTNTGFGNQTLMDPLHYVARPNGRGIPEPASATALAGLLLLARRRRR